MSTFSPETNSAIIPSIGETSARKRRSTTSPSARRFALLAAGAVLVPVLAGCGSAQQGEATPVPPANAPTATDTTTTAPSNVSFKETMEYDGNVFNGYINNGSGKGEVIPAGTEFDAKCVEYVASEAATSTKGLWYEIADGKDAGKYVVTNLAWNQTPPSGPDQQHIYDPLMANVPCPGSDPLPHF